MRTSYADELLARIERADLERAVAVLQENARPLRECAGVVFPTSRAIADAEEFENVAFVLKRLLRP